MLSVRPHFSNLDKQNTESNDRYYGSGQVDHWWHLSCISLYWCDIRILDCQYIKSSKVMTTSDNSSFPIPSKWKLTTSENSDPFFAALGVRYLTRKLANAANSYYTFLDGEEKGKDIIMKQELVKLKVSRHVWFVMFHSARPTVLAIVITIHLKFDFFCEILKNADGRTDIMYKNNYLYRQWLWVGRVDQYLNRLSPHFFQTTEIQFRLSEPFDETTGDGRQVRWF